LGFFFVATMNVAIPPIATQLRNNWVTTFVRGGLGGPRTRGERRLPGIFLATEKSIPQAAIFFQWRRSMTDAVLNVALFAALVLCIVGFGAWAHKRVP
jgi:hypothetical protein